jgi:hypothetical protein
LFAKRDAEAGGKDRTSAWQGVKQRKVGLALGALRNGCIKVCARRQGDPELGDKGVPQERLGGEDACSGGQRDGALDRLEAGGNEVSRAHMVVTEETLQGGATCALCGCEGGPAVQDVAKERRIFLVTPVQDMREGVFERPGQAIREADGVDDQSVAVLDEWREGAPGGALGRERGAKEERDLACGIGGVVFGPARGDASRDFARVSGLMGKSPRKS